MKLLIEELRKRCGQLIKDANLATDLKVSPQTISQWIDIFEEMYLGFRVYPYTKNVPRSLEKPCKFYFFDNGDPITDEGGRLENLIATTLLKRLHFIKDAFGYDTKLCYLRNKDGKEVDFATIIDSKVYELIEVKNKDTKISKALKSYSEMLNPKYSVQMVGNLDIKYEIDNIIITNPIDYFTEREENIAPWLLEDFKF